MKFKSVYGSFFIGMILGVFNEVNSKCPMNRRRSYLKAGQCSGSQQLNSTGQQSYSCYGPDSCLNLPISDFTLAEQTSYSPLYVIYTYDGPGANKTDNGCVTMFYTGRNYTYLTIRSLVNVDGSLSIQWFLSTSKPGQTGFFSYVGIVEPDDSSLVAARAFYLGVSCPGCAAIINYYRCGLYDSYPGPDGIKDTWFSLSSDPYPRDICVRRSLKVLQKNSCPDVNFIKPPNSRPFQCVTNFNGLSCINSQNVDPKFAISFP